MVQRGETISPPLCDEYVKINSLRPGEWIEGIYLGCVDGENDYGKTKLHRVFTPQKKIVGINGTSALNQRLVDLEPKPYVFITYVETKTYFQTLQNGTQEERKNHVVKVELGIEDGDTRKLRAEAPDESAKQEQGGQVDLFAGVQETPF